MSTQTQATSIPDEQLKQVRELIADKSLWCPLPARLAYRFAERRQMEFVDLIHVGAKLLLGMVALIVSVLWALFNPMLVGHDAQLWWWLVASTALSVTGALAALRLPFVLGHYVGFVATIGMLITANLLLGNMLARNPVLAQESSYLSMLVINVVILALRLPLQVGILAGTSALLLASVVGMALGAHPIWSLVLTSYLGTIVITLFVGLIMERQERINFLQGFLLEHESSERMRLNIILERLAAEDQLTGLANRRRFDAVLHHEWGRCQRGGQPLALLFIDVDYFKKFNDHYGHGAGDQCLTAVAQAIKGSLLRPADLAARYGGEEFVVILPETDLAGADDVAGRAAAHIQALAIPHERSDAARQVTVSIGIAVQVPARHSTSQALLEAADEAVYRAKGDGRNCIRHAPQAAAPQDGP